MEVGRATSLALVLAGGCRDEAETSVTGSSTGSSSEGSGTGGTTLGTTGGSTSASTDDTGRPTDTSTDTREGTSSSDATSRGDTGSTTGAPDTSGSTETTETGSSTDTGGMTGSTTDTGGTTGSTTESSSTTGGSTESSDTGTDTDETSECVFSESFDGIPDGSPWPAPWTPTGGVALADVQGGRGRVLPIPSTYGLGRMFVPLPESCVDVEGTLTFELTDGQSSGVGLYLRHNGGFLQQTVPPGRGFVAFVQAFGLATGISFWRELDGVETVLAPYTPQVILANTIYRLRYRVTQQDASTTRLRARVWSIEGIEPGVWHVDLTDQTPSLQGVGGGVCVDVWTQFENGVAADVFVDDIVVGPAP